MLDLLNKVEIMGIFKAYDVRGVYGKGIDNLFAYKLGRAFAQFSSSKTVMIGYDARTYSEELYKYFIKGLLEEGKIVGHIKEDKLYLPEQFPEYDKIISIYPYHFRERPSRFSNTSIVIFTSFTT